MSRVELKYYISSTQQLQLYELWQGYICASSFTNEQSTYPVLSLYYDSPALTFYHEKLDGTPLRKKVRLRTYGYNFSPSNTAFLEIKEKAFDKIKKIRVKLDPFDSQFLNPELWKLNNDILNSDVMALNDFYLLRPKVQTFYLRKPYEAPQWPNLRITFDSMLMALHPYEVINNDLFDFPSRQVISETMSILEIKSSSSLPEWVMEGIRNFELQEKRISKYVLCIEHLNINNLTGGTFDE